VFVLRKRKRKRKRKEKEKERKFAFCYASKRATERRTEKDIKGERRRKLQVKCLSRVPRN
jgi:hypothetical protein